MFDVTATVTEHREEGWNMEQQISESWNSLPEAFHAAATLANPVTLSRPGASWMTSEGAAVYVRINSESDPQRLAFFKFIKVRTRRFMQRIVDPDLMKRLVPYLPKQQIAKDQIFKMPRGGFEVAATPPGFSMETCTRWRNEKFYSRLDYDMKFNMIETLERRLADILYFKGTNRKHKQYIGGGHKDIEELMFTDKIEPGRINEVLSFFARSTDPRLPDVRTTRTLRKYFIRLEWLMEQSRWGKRLNGYVEDPQNLVTEEQLSTSTSNQS